MRRPSYRRIEMSAQEQKSTNMSTTQLDCGREVATYFRSSQWQELISLLRRLEQTSHIHLFVNTSLHPHSLEALVKGYLEARGLGVSRGNEILSPAPGRGTLHGIHPRGTPHFDLNWRFREDVVLEPMEEAAGEQSLNLLFWDDQFMNYFYRGYEWCPVGAPERAEIREYFGSAHWHRGFELILDPAIVHIHVNVETNVHPRVLEKYVTEAVETRGWKLHRVVPNVVRSQGIYYGKLMLLFEEPELSFDLGWVYNQNRVLAPCERQVFPGQADPGYMIVPTGDLDELIAASPYRFLSSDEISDCLRSVEDFGAGQLLSDHGCTGSV